MSAVPKTIGRYEILGLVGRGGMGVLYRARDLRLERDVALKMMHVDFTADPTARERFQREAKAVARLQHRNVVTIHELGEVEGTPYIVMELLSGMDLDAALKNATPMTISAKLDVVIQLCEGLAYAHDQGIVHRDIKPGNIRVLEDGTIKILDFGIARFVTSSVTQSGTIMGTPSYMAPEQILGQPLDGRADLFSVGVLLYELLSGQKPFAGDSATAVAYQIMHIAPRPVSDTVPELPETLNAIVAHALEKDPDNRYRKASELASDLRTVRMAVDPLLHGPAPVPGQSQATLGPLYATTSTRAAGVTAALAAPVLSRNDDATIVAGSLAPAAAVSPAPAAATTTMPPPAAAAGGGRSPALLAGIAVVAVLVLGGGWWMWRGQSSGSAASAADVGAPKDTAPKKEEPKATAPGPAHLLAISSVPPGAHISVGGTDTGKVTPAAVSLDAAQAKTLELSLKGYKTLPADLSDADLAAGSKEFKLVREAGPVRLSVTWSNPFEIVQGSRVISASSASHNLTIQPGGSAVIARNAGMFLETPIAIDFQKSQTSVTLPAPGTLTIFSKDETCSILVDGKDLGFPPISRKPAAAGNHSVTLKCPDGKQETRKVSVPTGEGVNVTFAGPPKEPRP